MSLAQASRDGGPELVIWREYPVVAMPVLPRRGDEIGEPVEELRSGRSTAPAGRPGSPASGPLTDGCMQGGSIPKDQFEPLTTAFVETIMPGNPLGKNHPGPHRADLAARQARR